MLVQRMGAMAHLGSMPVNGRWPRLKVVTSAPARAAMWANSKPM